MLRCRNVFFGNTEPFPQKTVLYEEEFFMEWIDEKEALLRQREAPGICTAKKVLFPELFSFLPCPNPVVDRLYLVLP